MSDIDIVTSTTGFEEEFTEHSQHKNSTKTFHHEPCGEINFKTETELKYFFSIWSPIESCKEELEDEGARKRGGWAPKGCRTWPPLLSNFEFLKS